MIHGKPYTWNGKNSLVKDNTLDSSIESLGNIATAAAVAVTAAKDAKVTQIPTTVDEKPPCDDATALRTKTILTQNQVN